MICPYCVKDIPDYSKNHPRCEVNEGKEFPPHYLTHHGRAGNREPIVLSVIGFGQHGKTVFLCALSHYIDHSLSKLWPGFHSNGLDQESLDTLYATRKELENKILPARTAQIFPRPGIFRLNDMPCIQDCDPDTALENTTVLIFDPPGEAFASEKNIVEFAPFVKRSDCVLFLVDLTKMGNSIPTEMGRLLDTYVLAMPRMQIKERTQHLIVVYTKSDDMKVSVPQFARLLADKPWLEAYLKEQLPPSLGSPRAHLRQLDAVSDALEDFTRDKLGAHKFIHQAEKWFASVSYTAVTSLGTAPEMQVNEKGVEEWRLAVEMSPRCVADPLLYVLAKSVKVRLAPAWWQRVMAKFGVVGVAAAAAMLSAAASTLLALAAGVYFLFFYNADYRRAYACEQRKDYVCAAENYTKAIESSPKYAEAYTGRGRSYMELGRHTEAYKDCGQASQLKTDFVEALTCRGMASVFNNAYSEALGDCAKAIELNPKYAEAYLCRGIIYWYRKQNVQAVKEYDTAIGLNPKFARAYFNRGSAHADSGNEAQARSDYQQAAELEPDLATTYYYRDHALAYNYRGAAYLKQGDYKESIKDFDKAIRLKRNYAEAYENRGVAYTGIREYKQGINDLTEALRLQPRSVTAYVSRGDAYYLSGDFDRAVSDFSSALALVSDAAEVYLKRGKAHFGAKRWDAAIVDYRKASKQRPNYYEAYLGLGDAYFLSGESKYKTSAGCGESKGANAAAYGDYHEAVESYDAAASLKPVDVRAIYNRGAANARRESYIEAITDYEKVSELDSKLASERNASYSNAFCRRGLLRYSQGERPFNDAYKDRDFSLAADDFRQALTLNPRNALAQRGLAKIETR